METRNLATLCLVERAYNEWIKRSESALKGTPPAHLVEVLFALSRSDITHVLSDLLQLWLERPPSAGESFTVGVLTVSDEELFEVRRAIQAECIARYLLGGGEACR